MNPGALRELVTVQQQVRTSDGQGGYTTTWSRVRDMFCEIRPLRGMELLQAQALNAHITHRLTTRWQPGLSPAHRVLRRNGSTLQIRGGWISADARRMYAQAFLEEDADSGTAFD